MSTGKYRVGIGFNPSGDTSVDRIKRAAADLIDIIEAEVQMQAASSTAESAREAERMRCRALAMTAAEEAAMWAVKAATKPVPES